jgi:glycosyltransferase involved in cell wall biosynthesis
MATAKKVILGGAMKNKKVRGVIFISNVTKAMEHEWFVDFTDKTKFDFEFVLFNSANSPLYNYITSKGFTCTNYALPSTYLVPFYISFFAVKLLVKRPDFVHCHLFLASVIGISAAKLAGIRKRIYTRHHTDVHHVYNPHAVKYDKMVNALSTHVIAVSKNSANILQVLENVPAEKITIINHGIPAQLMDKHVPPEQISEMRKRYQLQDKFPIIGVISRFVPEKGIQYIIPGFKLLLNDFPKAKLVLANARGNYEQQILSLLREIPQESYVLIPFELNVDPLFKNFDVFVHAPIDETCEAFGQVYIEALSMGIPMVCTLSGIANDLIIHERNALVPEYKNAESICKQIKRMLQDDVLRAQIIANGKEDVKEHTFEKKFEKIISVYLN